MSSAVDMRRRVRSSRVGEAGVSAHAGGRHVRAGHVVLCTNGFVDHSV